MSDCGATALANEPLTIRLSVHRLGEEEAQRHKWIESEKAGRDLGEWAIRCWVREHWNGFLRARWVEHLEGSKYWIELDHNDFGLLGKAFQNSRLITEILHKLKFGEENLSILNWALDQQKPMDETLEILETLDINSRRIECLFGTRISQND
ncbi:MAG: hypothetical protein NVSMB9_29040 [Isosphaeraceae bacterium]